MGIFGSIWNGIKGVGHKVGQGVSSIGGKVWHVATHPVEDINAVVDGVFNVGKHVSGGAASVVGAAVDRGEQSLNKAAKDAEHVLAKAGGDAEAVAEKAGRAALKAGETALKGVLPSMTPLLLGAGAIAAFIILKK